MPVRVQHSGGVGIGKSPQIQAPVTYPWVVEGARDVSTPFPV